MTHDTSYCNSEWAAVGEYGDPYDIMSHADTYQRAVEKFIRAGPGLNAYHLDRNGMLVHCVYVSVEKVFFLSSYHERYVFLLLMMLKWARRLDRTQQDPTLWR